MDLHELSSHLFSDHWAQLLCVHWNDHAAWHASMAGAGDIAFVLEGQGVQGLSRRLVLSWDVRGRLSIVAQPQGGEACPAFCGQVDSWAQVMRGEVSPVGAVLRGSIGYTGPFWFAAKYGGAFANIVEAQRQAIEGHAGRVDRLAPVLVQPRETGHAHG